MANLLLKHVKHYKRFAKSETLALFMRYHTVKKIIDKTDKF